MAKSRPETAEEGEVKKLKEKKASKDKVTKGDKEKKDKKPKKEKREKKERKQKSLDAIVQDRTAVADDGVDAFSEVRKQVVKEESVKNEVASRDESSDSVSAKDRQGSLPPNGGDITAPVLETKPKEEKTTKAKGPSSRRLFTVDIKPTRVDFAKLAQPSYNPAADELNPPVGTNMNRQARRRLKLIDRQREKIHKDLVKAGELEEGSEEFQSELQRRTGAWTQDRDEKEGARKQKKQERKERDRQKLRNKRGKLLTGRKLSERKKELVKEDKSKARKQRRLEAMED